MLQNRIHYLDPVEWTAGAVKLLMATVTQVCRANDSCSVMLTGGRSANLLYQALADSSEFRLIRNVLFYFGDERCVPPDHPESNYGLAMRTLFKDGVPPSCKVIRITAEQLDRCRAAADYDAQLPEKIDVLLLSIGDDGHIASLFPHSAALLEIRRRVVYVQTAQPPVERITITPRVITQAKRVYVMALGPIKADVYQHAKMDPHNIANLPARLVLNAIWLLDTKPTV